MKNPVIGMKIYRIERWLYVHKLKMSAYIVSKILYVLCNCSIYPSTVIGENTIFPHSVGIVIHQNSVIGDSCTIYQNVTLGNGNGPQIGNNVVVGCGAVILGDITIGNNVNIGANAVVLKDVPDNCTVVGVPGRIVKNNVQKHEDK